MTKYQIDSAERDLQTAISKASDERDRFLELGSAGSKVVRELDKAISEAQATLQDIKNANPAIVRSLIRKLL